MPQRTPAKRNPKGISTLNYPGQFGGTLKNKISSKELAANLARREESTPPSVQLAMVEQCNAKDRLRVFGSPAVARVQWMVANEKLHREFDGVSVNGKP
jgi:hypothetical protein